MAQVEPMDIDAIESDFDNKENAFQCNNVLSRTPCTEKGYEELDVSELNMKLRYSITPASSPMSKSLTGPCLDNRNCVSEDHLNNTLGAENGNLTRSLNSTLSKPESSSKSKVLPLQTLSTEPFIDSNRNSSMRRLLDQTDNKVIISVENANDIDENLSLPSPCSSVPDTPEATTPTKDIPKPEGSPIMRGLKSVLSMFRSSQSPILLADNDKSIKPEILSPGAELNKSELGTVQVSTPVSENKQKDANSSKRSSPLKESLVFNDDLERELLWKDETTIFFKEEKIPVYKLFFQNPIPTIVPKTLNTTVEHTDISCDESVTVDKINIDDDTSDQFVKNEQPLTGESDNEFLDCETTFTKDECNVKNMNEVEMGNKIQDVKNITIDLSHNAEIPTEISSEHTNDSKYNNIITPNEISLCANKVSSSSSNVYSQMDIKNYANIIEATVNFLQNESIDYNKITVTHDMDSKQVNQLTKELELKEQNTTLTIENEIVKDKIHTAKGTTESANSLKGEEITESVEKSYSNSYKHLEDGADSLNSSDNVTKKNSLSDIVADQAVTTDKSSSINRTIDTLSIDLIGHEANIDKQNELVSLQKVEVELNTDLSITNEDTRIAQNNDVPPNIIESQNVEDIMINNTSIEKATENEDYMCILKDYERPEVIEGSDSANSGNLEIDFDFNTKTINVVPLTEESKYENDIVSSNDMLNNSSASPNIQFEALNATIVVDSKPDFIEENVTPSSNRSDMESILEVKRESSEIKSGNNCELKKVDNILTSNVVNNLSFVIDNHSEVHDIKMENTTITTLPSEIPLPDEDDIKQNILNGNDLCNKDFNNQDITAFYTCDKHVENVDNINDVKSDQSINTSNILEENDKASVINSVIESNCKVINSEAPLDKAISTHLQEVDVKSLDLKSENFAQDKLSLDLNTADISIPHKENFSNNLPESEIFNNEESSKGSIRKDIVDKPFEKTLPDNAEQISCIAERAKVITDEYSNVTSLSKPEYTNQGETVEKGVDEIDEELITSANNSPYVSVTDLDKVVEKIPNDTKEDIDIPLDTYNSPPISPKIVSKGYNFNFDEIDDPFATKTKIRMSPTPDTPSKSFSSMNEENKVIKEMPKKVNRRKSQTERKRPIQKKNVNSTFSDKLTIKESKTENLIISAVNTSTDAISYNNLTFHVKDNNMSECKPENTKEIGDYHDNKSPEMNNSSKSVTSNSEDISINVAKVEIKSGEVDIKNIDQTIVLSSQQQQSTSSSEQYFSLGTSSGETSSVMNRSKNVFNLPEIDDSNFNPFATKSKMRMSPPPADKPSCSMETLNNASDSLFKQPSDNNNFINKCTENTFDGKIENDSLSTSNNTLSSHTNDVDTTVREIHTEDEDTVEGPFLEFDNLNENQKVNDTDADMMNFEEIPQTERDENLENGELFIDADAFEFLLNQNKSATVLDSGKESLFLKFDPLFAKRVSSDGILAALSKVQKRQSTPKKVAPLKQQDFIPIEKTEEGPSNIENCGPVEDYNDDLSSNVTKPMMVVNPAVSSVITQKKPVTPKLNRRSLTFTSPAMAVIDRLLSLSGNSSHLDHNTSIPHSGRELSETDLAITQLRELLAEKEINVHTLRSESKELKDRLSAMELRVKGLETESSTRLAKINELNEKLMEKTKINKSMAIVVEEYERTIASLIAETEQDKKRNAEERMRLIKERDEQTAHLTSMEVSFSDLHSKYEKSKQIILSCKANEDIYKKSIKEFQENFSKMQNNYELLKQHATSKLNHANQELEKMNRAHEAEVLKMNAMIKRKELHITSLEETLAQKTKANEELTAICDELINKVG